MTLSPEQPHAQPVDDAPHTVGGDAPSTSTSTTVPPSLATMAANHPYSTAFLLGAALTGSAVIGGFAARRALGQNQRAFLAAQAAAKPATRVPSAVKGEYDSRLLKLEALVKDAQQANKKMAEQMVAIPQLVRGLERVQADLAQEQSAALKAQRAYWDQKFESNQALSWQMCGLELTEDRGSGSEAERGAYCSDREGRRQPAGELTCASHPANRQNEKSVAQAFRTRMTTDVQQMLTRLTALETDVKQLSAELVPPKPAADAKPAEKKATSSMEDEEEGGLDATQGDFCFFPQREAPSTSSAPSAGGAAARGAAGSGKSKPWTSDRAETRSHQPIARLGVDESGEWKFKLDPATQGTDQLFGSHLKPRSIVLCRQSEKRSELGLPFLSSTTKMTYVYGPFVTGIVFNPEVDMVLLDGAWWRVTEDDGVFTVREKVADDSL